ncbi:hypothetical protein N7520_010290 [Penicillium odoratum]|uniref:uncharacterized protein n=1 Tax=Penicillium odoratum TaxID=1167516 RepID=UPI0025472C10|nr:uncharacterized protein N7520_010290 [Penicillium odoratum]KAJ5745108.1 hypothetical protein N7520_010290 [Penicillium odoratum]
MASTQDTWRSSGIPPRTQNFTRTRNNPLNTTLINVSRQSGIVEQSFAGSKLCSGEDSQAHQFARARNARLIMSNTIPDMQNPATKLYCIWYPEPASEETYRELALGRVCAAASFTNLYKDLDLLPDVSIAEEACNAAEDAEIYRIIMLAP